MNLLGIAQFCRAIEKSAVAYFRRNHADYRGYAKKYWNVW